MLLAGAKGLAKQILPILRENYLDAGLVVYDRNQEIKSFYEFGVINKLEDVDKLFKTGNSDYILGMGTPFVRKRVSDELTRLCGKPFSLISSSAIINEDVLLGIGNTILPGVVMENGSRTGSMCLLNLRCLICHDVQLGDFCEVGLGAILLGESSVGDGSFIGAGAILNPGVRVGKNAVVASGAVVTRDVPDNTLVAGVPAGVKKRFAEAGY
jgi:sugar O-acyltransferase (sialic acid O-acetyltransferase NeuD family)